VLASRAVSPYVTWLIHMCDMPHPMCVTFISVTGLIHMCDMIHSYVWSKCVTRLIHMCDVPHPRGWHDLFSLSVSLSGCISHTRMSHATQANGSCHTGELVMSHMRMSHVTHVNASCHTFEWMSYGAHMHEWRNTREDVMSHIIRTCDMNNSFVWVETHTRTHTLPHAQTYIYQKRSQLIRRRNVKQTMNNPFEDVLSNIRIGRSPHIKPDTSHTRISHVTHMQESCHV